MIKIKIYVDKNSFLTEHTVRLMTPLRVFKCQ